MAEFSSANKDILKILQKPLKKQTNGEKKVETKYCVS